jgi:Trk K+ transport system NAD-binding subunit
MLKEMDIPASCLVIAVRRQGEEIIPNGDTLIKANDVIVVWTEKSMLADAHHYFDERCNNKKMH